MYVYVATSNYIKFRIMWCTGVELNCKWMSKDRIGLNWIIWDKKEGFGSNIFEMKSTII